MRQSIVRHLFFLLFLFGITFFLPTGVSAAGCDVSVTPNASDSTVLVTVSDANLNGKEISVICYEPGRTGNVSDLTGNRNSIVYINQYTVTGTVSFTFKIKKPLVQGQYSLVVTSEREQVVSPFYMIPELKQTEKPAQPSVSPASPTPKLVSQKTLKAPAGVKAKSAAKKKVTVTWKKVTGAKGYIIGTATKKNGKYKTKLTVTGGSKKKTTLKKMKSGKVYYIKVRAYQLSGKKKVAGKWSKAIKVKVR